MYIDYETKLSSAQAVVSSGASDNYIDLGVARDIGNSEELYLMVQVTTTAASSGSTTVAFSLQCDDNTSFSSAKTVIDSGAIAKATLVAGYQMFIPIPPGCDEQYVRLYYTVGTANMTAGAFTAAIVQAPQLSKAYTGAGA